MCYVVGTPLFWLRTALDGLTVAARVAVKRLHELSVGYPAAGARSRISIYRAAQLSFIAEDRRANFARRGTITLKGLLPTR
jgi:hypothetical protein